MRVAFYRYLQNFSTGPGDWVYQVYGIVEDGWKIGQNEFQEMALTLQKYASSFTYRGCCIEEVQDPPKEWLREELRRQESTSQGNTKIASYLRQMVKEIRE